MSKLACLVLSLLISVIVGVAQADPDADADPKIQSQSQAKTEVETQTEPEIFFDDELFGDRSFFGGSFKNAIVTDTKIPTAVTTTTTTSTTAIPEPEREPEIITFTESSRPPSASPVPDQNIMTRPRPVNEIMTTADLDESLLNWEAPLWFRQNIPYYLAGHDDDGRPVWISEIGRYPLKQLAEMGPEDSQVFDTYISQLALRMFKSIQAQNTTGEVTDGFVILDFDGFAMSQLASPKSVLIIVRIFKAYSGLLINYLGICIAINVNYVAEFALSLAKPVLGRAADKLEVFGTNPVKWRSVLRNRLPQEAIPSWYGGPKDFRPIKVYG